MEIMGSDSNGGPCRSLVSERPNVFALVIYIPDPLGRFLDDLRRELVPHYNPHAHVSVLPPRVIRDGWRAASEQARRLTAALAPFDVELTTIQVFSRTDVIFIEIGDGAQKLYDLHDAMNRDHLAFDEPYAYHPHITLAQEIPHDLVGECTELARRRWEEYEGSRVFRAERAMFVQNTVDNCWVDLAEYSLGAVPAL
jgi:2'-5' RNA ligase